MRLLGAAEWRRLGGIAGPKRQKRRREVRPLTVGLCSVGRSHYAGQSSDSLRTMREGVGNVLQANNQLAGQRATGRVMFFWPQVRFSPPKAAEGGFDSRYALSGRRNAWGGVRIPGGHLHLIEYGDPRTESLREHGRAHRSPAGRLLADGRQSAMTQG